MSLSHTNPANTTAEALRQENDALKDRLAALREASISISEKLDAEAVLQQAIDSA